MKYRKTAAAFLALSLSFVPLLAAMSSNTSPHPLKSVLPGAGTSIGVDLANECLSGSVLPIANGGSGGGSYTAHGVIMGQGTSGFSASSAGTSGKAFISGGASADGAYGTLGVSGGGTGLATITAHGVVVGEGTSAVTPLTVGTNGQVLVGSTGADPAFATITSTGGSIAVTGGAGTLNLDTTKSVQKATYNLTAANIVAMNGSPITVLAGISGKTIVVDSIDMTYTFGTAAYTGGGNISFLYHGGNTITAGTVGAGAITAGSGSTYSAFAPVSAVGAQNTGIDITNATSAFVNPGTATGTAVINIYYRTF